MKEFESLNSNKWSVFYTTDMDRLRQPRFSLFEANQNTALSDNNFELDSSFNTNKIQCDYFLSADFNSRMINENIQVFQINLIL